MNPETLHQLAQKYWKGTCTDREEQMLLEYVRDAENLSPELEPLRAYAGFLDAERSEVSLGDEFDQQFMAKIKEPNPVRRLNSAWLGRAAAAVALVVGFSWGFYEYSNRNAQVIEDEFVDTYEDPEIAYMEVKKALMKVSSKMNSGMKHTRIMVNFHQSQKELTKH
ncbi:MAG: hypothetical protein AAGI38_09760 [Bacteroidota bacterium]